MTSFSRTQHGLLELTFEARGGRTYLMHDRQQSPLKIVRPFECEDGGLMVFVINPTAGVLGGDRFQIRLELGPGAKVLLLSQSAQKVHRMNPGQHATQHLEATIAMGARLEYYPERLIPFANSSFSQQNHFYLEPGAQLGLLESYASGRVAHGEHWAFERLNSQTKVFQSNQLVYLDRFDLRPALAPLTNLGAMQEYPFWASGLFVGKSQAPIEPPTSPLLSWGTTAFGHHWLRAVGASGLSLDRGLKTAVNHFRTAYFDLGELVVRR